MCQRFVSMESEEKSLLGCNEQILDSSGEEDGSSPVIPSSPDNAAPPELVKRPTRKWAAWTREEEECFFTALRQVGKNFQKITSRVKSKNKDQVRHYYYRLVRRMNKLLGPGLCLDAKNSRDTNAAMLRWWSLLEKYSCKASKLHLKPRRFKIFLEALEHQLLKDRKKNVKKQLSQGESSISPTSTCQNQIKSSGNDLRAVKAVTADGQNVEKLGNGKGSSTRRSSNLGVTRSSNKGESSSTKPTRQRRKTGVVSTATLKKWEKAAMAGVSLVADAAEHVERTSGGNMASFLDGLTVLSAQAVCCTMEKNDPGPSGQQVQANSLIKLKLQLFPIDDNTRRALETDKHNPHLELTLSTRKKISSVLEHIGRKWGSSNVAAGELMLFPFDIQRENISGYQKWTRDSVATATDVYAMVGSPSIFRLRYGWVVTSECQLATETESPVGKDEMGKHVGYTSGDQPTTVSNAEKILEPTTGSTSDEIEFVVDHRLKKTPTLSAGEWADSLTNVSTGDILPDVPDNAIPSCSEIPVQNSRCLEELPFTCDSFDAAIAAHISSQYKSGFSRPSPCLSSIWDAEETCDEFTFRKSAVSHKQDPYPAMAAGSLSGEKSANPSSANIDDLQDLAEETMAEDVSEEDQMDDCPSEPCEIGNLSKDFSSLTDIYWPESLGPLELDVPSCKYYSEGLILSDSMSGLNRLIASSLDAFQHFPLFGLDDKVPSPAPGAQRGASFTGKIGTGDSAGVPSLQV